MEIIKAEPSQIGKFDNFESLEEMTKFASTLISSGILPPNYKSPESVIATIIQGKELGLKAMTSLQNIHFISSKPTLGANAIAALIRGRGVDYQTIKDAEPVKNAEGKSIDLVTTIRFFRFSHILNKVLEEDCSFSWQDAVAAGLTGKDVWKKFPSQMLHARCLAKGARRVAGDILLGVYETTEMADSTNTNYNLDEEGQVTIIK